MAALMELIFSRNDYDRGDAGDYLVLMYEKNPLLFYAAAEVFRFSPEQRNAFESITGKSLQQALTEIEQQLP